MYLNNTIGAVIAMEKDRTGNYGDESTFTKKVNSDDVIASEEICDKCGKSHAYEDGYFTLIRDEKGKWKSVFLCKDCEKELKKEMLNLFEENIDKYGEALLHDIYGIDFTEMREELEKS